jgi:hypothetical protein
MKSLQKALTTASQILTDYDSKYLFCASEVLSLLLQIRELRDFQIGMTEIFEGGLQFSFSSPNGTSIYQIFQSADNSDPE